MVREGERKRSDRGTENGLVIRLRPVIIPVVAVTGWGWGEEACQAVGFKANKAKTANQFVYFEITTDKVLYIIISRTYC